MNGLWRPLLGYAWELAAAGFIGAVLIGIFGGPGDDYSCAPADSEDEGEEIPEDPDRAHDWAVADEMGAY